MKLHKYLEKNRISQTDFGKSLVPSVSQSLISQWCNGLTRISLLYALQIKEITKGAVTPQDCADMYLSKKLPVTQSAAPSPPHHSSPASALEAVEAKREAA